MTLSATDVLMALSRGGGSALAVTGVLLAAHRLGRDRAGLLAGLPTVSGPAMVWLALDHGGDFAGHAAHGAVAAAVPCALFALTYACLAPMRGRLAALLCAVGSCLFALWLLSGWQWPMHVTLALVATTCVLCLALMPRSAPRSVPEVSRDMVLRAGATTVLVSAAVSVLVSLLAPALAPRWAGMLTSQPLLAVPVVWQLHRQGCPARVQDFRRGYTTGLMGRSLFMAVFSALLVPQGLTLAIGAALTATLLIGWASHAWMQLRSRLALVRVTSG